MQAINANTYYATTQAVSDAIALSIRSGERVQLEASGHVLAAVQKELSDECEGSDAWENDDPRAGAYWGRDVEGRRWQIYVLPIG